MLRSVKRQPKIIEGQQPVSGNLCESCVFHIPRVLEEPGLSAFSRRFFPRSIDRKVLIERKKEVYIFFKIGKQLVELHVVSKLWLKGLKRMSALHCQIMKVIYFNPSEQSELTRNSRFRAINFANL